jgi:hypothetical protein
MGQRTRSDIRRVFHATGARRDLALLRGMSVELDFEKEVEDALSSLRP